MQSNGGTAVKLLIMFIFLIPIVFAVQYVNGPCHLMDSKTTCEHSFQVIDNKNYLCEWDDQLEDLCKPYPMYNLMDCSQINGLKDVDIDQKNYYCGLFYINSESKSYNCLWNDLNDQCYQSSDQCKVNCKVSHNICEYPECSQEIYQIPPSHFEKVDNCNTLNSCSYSYQQVSENIARECIHVTGMYCTGPVSQGGEGCRPTISCSPSGRTFALNVICTDNDHDSYNSEGGSCGPKDCADKTSDCNSLAEPAKTRCRNNLNNINPLSLEYGDERCSDGLDNDCDGKTDSDDEDCIKPRILYIIADPENAFTSDLITYVAVIEYPKKEDMYFLPKITFENEKGPFRPGYDEERNIQRPRTFTANKVKPNKVYEYQSRYRYEYRVRISPSMTRIGDKITLNLTACFDKDIYDQIYTTCSDSSESIVNVPHCPPDTVCTDTWPNNEVNYNHQIGENIKSCNLFTVCDKSIAYLIDQAEGKCSHLSDSNSYKECLKSVILSNLGPNKKWMEGYWAQEICCGGNLNIFSQYGCSVEDFRKCSNNNPIFKNLNKKSQQLNLKCKIPKLSPTNDNEVRNIIPPLGWEDDLDMSKNSCWFSNLPAYVSLLKLKTGTCVDYSVALTTLLRKAGYTKDEIFSASIENHMLNIIFDRPGSSRFKVYDITGNAYIPPRKGIIIGDIAGYGRTSISVIPTLIRIITNDVEEKEFIYD